MERGETIRFRRPQLRRRRWSIPGSLPRRFPCRPQSWPRSDPQGRQSCKRDQPERRASRRRRRYHHPNRLDIFDRRQAWENRVSSLVVLPRRRRFPPFAQVFGESTGAILKEWRRCGDSQSFRRRLGSECWATS